MAEVRNPRPVAEARSTKASANVRNLKFIQPPLEALFSTAEQALAFEDASAALEAGRLVRALREQAKLTQAGLAERLGVSQPRVSAIEAGVGRDGPSYALLRRIAVACGATWDLSAALLKPAEVRAPHWSEDDDALQKEAVAVGFLNPLVASDDDEAEEPAAVRRDFGAGG